MPDHQPHPVGHLPSMVGPTLPHWTCSSDAAWELLAVAPPSPLVPPVSAVAAMRLLVLLRFLMMPFLKFASTFSYPRQALLPA